jgi:hypothetical protein
LRADEEFLEYFRGFDLEQKVRPAEWGSGVSVIGCGSFAKHPPSVVLQVSVVPSVDWQDILAFLIGY